MNIQQVVKIEGKVYKINKPSDVKKIQRQIDKMKIAEFNRNEERRFAQVKMK